MELRDLRCFVSVYDAENFGRAAEVLNTTQSSVSARIRKLEQEFEGPLFVRLHRGIAATAKGELAYRYAKEVIARADEIVEAIRTNDAAA
jgi:DNA-binding transcriptional LysR family regulator